MTLHTIYMRLTDEAIEVWRPVEAEWLNGDTYRICDKTGDQQTEAWEFEPGDTVSTKIIDSADGPIRAAVQLVDRV